jgi:membrane protease YdiL (CAAX protease family)
MKRNDPSEWNDLVKPSRRNLNLFSAFSIFALATGYFFLLLYTLYPFLKTYWVMNGATYWFITGYFLFIPLFAAAIIGAFVEGNRSWGTIFDALNVRPLTRSDWYWAVGSLFGLLLLTGMVFGLSAVSHAVWGTRELNTTPWFMHMEPFGGTDRWLLLLWFPMFFFNIVGEEILWRGYVQSRLAIQLGWILCSLLWYGFHIPFGIDLLLVLLPTMFVIPFAFHKTRNTLVTIFIHGMFNGPMFVAVSLGLLE